MLRLTRKMVLALEAVLDVAYNARPDPVQAKEITARQGIPARYLEQVMQHLVRRGILKGVRGPRGGYTLARERRRITVGEVLRVLAELEGEGDEDPASGGELGEKIVVPLLEEVQEEALRRLDRITLEELCRRAKACGVARGGRGANDFVI